MWPWATSVGNCAGPVSISAAIGGASQSFTHNSSDPGNIWGSYGFDFVASAASETLTILGQSLPRGGNCIGLDNVSVTPGSVSAVPEPTNCALMLGGLGAIIALARKRRG